MPGGDSTLEEANEVCIADAAGGGDRSKRARPVRKESAGEPCRANGAARFCRRQRCGAIGGDGGRLRRRCAIGPAEDRAVQPRVGHPSRAFGDEVDSNIQHDFRPRRRVRRGVENAQTSAPWLCVSLAGSDVPTGLGSQATETLARPRLGSDGLTVGPAGV